MIHLSATAGGRIRAAYTVEGQVAVVFTEAQDIKEVLRVLERAHRQHHLVTGERLPLLTELTNTLAEVGSKSGTSAHIGRLQASQWLTTTEVAAHLGIGRRAVLKQIASGQLPARRLGHQWVIDLDEIT